MKIGLHITLIHQYNLMGIHINLLTGFLFIKGEVPLSMQRENIFFAKKIFFAILQLKYIAFALKLTNVLKLTVLHSFPIGKNVLKVQNIC